MGVAVAWWAVGVQDRLKSLVTGPSLLVNCYLFFLMGVGLLKVQRMGTSPFHSPKVSAHKKLSTVV